VNRRSRWTGAALFLAVFVWSAVATEVRPVNVPADSSPTAITTRVGASVSAPASGR